MRVSFAPERASCASPSCLHLLHPSISAASPAQVSVAPSPSCVAMCPPLCLCATLRRLARRTAEVSHVFYSLVCLVPAKAVFPPACLSASLLFLRFPLPPLLRSSFCLALTLRSLVPKQQPNIYLLFITIASSVPVVYVFYSFTRRGVSLLRLHTPPVMFCHI